MVDVDEDGGGGSNDGGRKMQQQVEQQVDIRYKPYEFNGWTQV
jgi:hypothetical protein